MKMNNSITRKQVIEAVNPTNLSHCDMAVLKKKDPFMYYSIPGNLLFLVEKITLT
jgi:hypothetical protein